jgi:hypothetical protein
MDHTLSTRHEVVTESTDGFEEGESHVFGPWTEFRKCYVRIVKSLIIPTMVNSSLLSFTKGTASIY